MELFTLLALLTVLMLLVGLLIALMCNYYYLLRRIARQHPDYYKAIGSPFLPALDGSISRTIKRDRYNYVLLRRLISGIPGSFPADARLRTQARLVRAELIGCFSLFWFGIGLLLGSL